MDQGKQNYLKDDFALSIVDKCPVKTPPPPFTFSSEINQLAGVLGFCLFSILSRFFHFKSI